MTFTRHAQKSFPQDHFRKPLRETPFYPRIQALSTTHDWHGWAGCLATGVIRNESAEYFSVRNAASVFDISPMIKYRIQGPDAEPFLDKLTLRDVTKLGVNRVQYTAWCTDEGKVIDDGTIFRRAKDDFLLFCPERHFEWLTDTAFGYNVDIIDMTEEIAGLSLQGPTACAVLKRVGFEGIETLRPFQIRDYSIESFQITVSRTGYTGDLGYELQVSPEGAITLWYTLFEAGDIFGITAIGSKALDLARLEAGFIQTGSEFVSATNAIRANRRRSPFELGLGWMVAFDKPAFFNGRTSLLLEKNSGRKAYANVGLEIEGNISAEHALVYAGRNREVGHITAAAWSPTTKRNIAIASIKAECLEQGSEKLWVDIYTLRELEWFRIKARARIVDRPFFVHKRRTATPPLDF